MRQIYTDYSSTGRIFFKVPARFTELKGYYTPLVKCGQNASKIVYLAECVT